MGKLPSPIPGNVYRYVETRIRHRSAYLARALESLSEAEQDAGAIGSPGAEKVGSGGGGSDRVSAAALRISDARDRVVKCQAWIRVYQLTMEAFQGTDAFRCVRLIFDRAASQAEAARAISRDRQTVRRYKDEFVIRAAFLAVSMGLIRMSTEGRLSDQNGDHRQPDQGPGA